MVRVPAWLERGAEVAHHIGAGRRVYAYLIHPGEAPGELIVVDSPTTVEPDATWKGRV